MSNKFCKDCVFYLPASDNSGASCTEIVAGTSPITGEHAYHSCAGRRSNTFGDNHCGPEAKRFKALPRPPKPWYKRLWFRWCRYTFRNKSDGVMELIFLAFLGAVFGLGIAVALGSITCTPPL